MAENKTYKAPKVRKQRGPRYRSTIVWENPKYSKQSFADECDVNNIVNRYRKTGFLPPGPQGLPQYGRASSVDFAESMRIVTAAQQTFAEQPAHIRKRFQNNPGAFLDFVYDENNVQEMAELGLIDDDALKRLSEPQKAPAAAPNEPLETTENGGAAE